MERGKILPWVLTYYTIDRHINARFSWIVVYLFFLNRYLIPLGFIVNLVGALKPVCFVTHKFMHPLQLTLCNLGISR